MKNESKPYFPLFVDLSQKSVIVIGAGAIAARRVGVLVEFGCRLTVVAPRVSPSVRLLAEKGRIRLKEKAYEREDLYGADLVLAATDDPALNEEIHSVCKCLGILVNVASDRNKCDFHFPGIIKREQLVVGVNAGGTDHKRAKEVRELIAQVFDERLREEQHSNDRREGE